MPSKRKRNGAMRRLRIFVVDDDGVVGVLLGDMLAQMGHICSVEISKAAAVAVVANFKPQLMIVDAELGDGSGQSAVDEIPRSGLVPHVFISGDSEWIRLLSLRTIAIQKPFRREHLIRAMNHALGDTADH
jgi:DNA-binding response OmpR family regulator